MTDRAVEVGRVIGDRWRIERFIAAGGFGQVFAARDVSSAAIGSVALKVLFDGASTAERRAFVAEVSHIAALRHPNIVGYIDAGLTEAGGQGAVYVVTELCDESLADYVAHRPGRTMPAELIGPLLDDIRAGLQHLHATGRVHRDLKPANILRSADTWKLADFGLVRDLTGSGVYHVGQLVGTPRFMAPEFFLPDATIGPPADIWSVGVLLHDVCAGRPVLSGDGMALMLTIMNGEVRIDPELDPAVAGLIARCLDPDPLRRPSAAELLVASASAPASPGATTVAVAPPVRPVRAEPASESAAGPVTFPVGPPSALPVTSTPAAAGADPGPKIAHLVGMAPEPAVTGAVRTPPPAPARPSGVGDGGLPAVTGAVDLGGATLSGRAGAGRRAGWRRWPVLASIGAVVMAVALIGFALQRTGRGAGNEATSDTSADGGTATPVDGTSPASAATGTDPSAVAGPSTSTDAVGGGPALGQRRAGDCVEPDLQNDRLVLATKVDCDQPHVYEVYGVIESSAAGGPFPGADALGSQAGIGCQEAFIARFGLDPQQTRLQPAAFVPIEEEWAADVFNIVCVVSLPTLEPFDGPIGTNASPWLLRTGDTLSYLAMPGGACFDTAGSYSADAGLGQFGVYSLCTDPHDGELYATLLVGDLGSDYPAELASEAAARCHQSLHERFGEGHRQSGITSTALYPSMQEWDSFGLKLVKCAVLFDPPVNRSLLDIAGA